MRPLLLALAALITVSATPVSAAWAADLSGVLSTYLLNKVPPSREYTKSPGLQARVWDRPAPLGTGKLLFLFAYGISQDHWALILVDPRLPAKTYLGSDRLTRLATLQQPAPITVYRVDGGRFQGFFLEDGVDAGHHLLQLYTPKMAAITRELTQYVK